jgi:type I restriction enzyme, S subunit
MNSEWEIRSITEIVNFNPSYTISRGSKVPYVEMAAIPEHVREISYFQERKFKSGSKFVNGDTLFSRITPCLQNGKTSRVSGLNNDQVANGSTEFIVISAKNISDKSFVYYLSLDKEFRKFAEGRMEGTSGRQRVSSQSLSEYELLLPPIANRKKIGQILSTLDDKIELNRNMNQTLEDMAQGLFKSWFVNFKPVHAKANASSDADYDQIAKELGMSREILDLFPDKFEESGLGKIPKGWVIKKLGECDFQIESGKRPKGGIDKELNYGFPSVGAESISPIGAFDYSKEKYITKSFAKTIKSGKISNFDVVLYKDGARLSDNECLNDKLSIYGEDFPYKEFFINEHIYILRSEDLGQFFLYYLMTSKNSISHLVNCATSKAAQPGLNQTEVKDLKFLSPELELIEAFNNLVSPIVKKQLNNGRKNNDLSKLRDLLLPKLLSGEIEVSDMELEDVSY